MSKQSKVHCDRRWSSLPLITIQGRHSDRFAAPSTPGPGAYDVVTKGGGGGIGQGLGCRVAGAILSLRNYAMHYIAVRKSCQFEVTGKNREVNVTLF